MNLQQQRGGPPIQVTTHEAGSLSHALERVSGEAYLVTDPLTPRQRLWYGPPWPTAEAPWLLLEGPLGLAGRPLHGCRVVVTRQLQQGEEVAGRLRRLGADVIVLPVVEFEPLEFELPQVAYDWLIFTSANGVDFFFQRLWDQGRDVRAVKAARIAVMGPGTARALERWRLRADLTPREFVAESLLESLQRFPLQDQRILLARAQEARDTLPQGLERAGALLDVRAVYRTRLPEVDPRQLELAAQAEWVMAASSSTITHYAQLRPERAQGVLAIGPITAQKALELGFQRVETASVYTLDGMVERLLELQRAAKSPPSRSAPEGF